MKANVFVAASASDFSVVSRDGSCRDVLAVVSDNRATPVLAKDSLEFSRYDRVLSRFQPTQMSRQTRTMNGSKFMEAKRRTDFEMRALKFRCRGIDDEIGRQRLRGKDR